MAALNNSAFFKINYYFIRFEFKKKKKDKIGIW